MALYERIKKDIARLNRPAVVGINGAITSGKTVFARKLEDRLRMQGYRTQVIHVDDFHFPRSVSRQEASAEYYLDHAVDMDRLAQLLREMQCGAVRKNMTLVDLATDQYSKEVTFETDQDTLVIVEGVLLFRPPVYELLDYKIYLDIGLGEILRRGRMRDVPRFGEQILRQYTDFFIPVQALYERRFSPKEQSDLVVDYNDVQNPVILK